MKTCWSCRVTKPLEQFGSDRTASDGRQHRCWECYRAWYTANKSRVLAAASSRRIAIKEASRHRLEVYLREHPCVDCGETDLRVLELDHRPDEPKRQDISRLIGGAYNWSIIAREIAKCDVRCVNCHRRRTMERANSWRQAVYLEQLALVEGSSPSG